MQAVSSGLVTQLTKHVRNSDGQICRASCDALSSLAQVLQGRLAMLQANSVVVITAALLTEAQGAAQCLQVCSSLSHMLQTVGACPCVSEPQP